MKGSLTRALKNYKAKRYENALKELLSLDKDPMEFPDIAYYLGLCYTRLEQFDDALIYLEQVVTSDSDILHKYQSRMILSYIYTITKRLSLAQFELTSLLEEGYESAQVYTALSFIAYKQNSLDKSKEYLELAVSLDPQNPNTLNSLGYILAEEGKDAAKAVTFCKKAVLIKPDNPAYLDSLGWAYFKMGNMEEARTFLRKALNLTSGEKEKTIAGHLKEVIEAEHND